MDPTLRIDPDIRDARTLPGSAYRSPAILDRQRERIFARSWQWIPGDARPGPETALPWTLLPGFLDEPLVWTRDRDGGEHLLSNVCTHRGNLICPEAVSGKELRCRYHGRRFALDGTFRFMPEFEGVREFPGRDDDLPVLPVRTWGPLAFTAIQDPGPFEDWFGPVSSRMGWLPLDTFRRADHRDYTVGANWALYLDNYLEGFHIPYVHPALHQTLVYRDYATETFASGSVQIGVPSPGEPAFTLPEGHPDQGRSIGAYYFWLFPNLMLNFYPWGLSMNLVEPLAVDRTRVRFVSYVWRPELREAGAGGDLHGVEFEDEAIVEQVQAGVRSRLYDRGRYSPSREQGPHHFHRLLVAAMGPEPWEA